MTNLNSERKPKWKRVLFPCPRCNAPVTENEYRGANLQSRFYHCKHCGEIIKKPTETKSESQVIKCPSCGEVMRRRYRKGRRARTGVAYECVNEKCPIIEIVFRYARGKRKSRTLMDVSIRRDPTLRG